MRCPDDILHRRLIALTAVGAFIVTCFVLDLKSDDYKRNCHCNRKYDQKNAEKDLQELTDKYIKKVDDACAVKEKELMEL